MVRRGQSELTGLHSCMGSQAFANPEDTGLGKTAEEKKKMLRTDPDVERARRYPRGGGLCFIRFFLKLIL